MASKHRLVKIAKSISISVGSIIDFLEKKGLQNLNQNSKISDEHYKMVIEEFVKDKKKKNALLQALTEPKPKREKSKDKKDVSAEKEIQHKSEKQEIISAKEEAKKRITPPKTVDKIDLNELQGKTQKKTSEIKVKQPEKQIVEQQEQVEKVVQKVEKQKTISQPETTKEDTGLKEAEKQVKEQIDKLSQKTEAKPKEQQKHKDVIEIIEPAPQTEIKQTQKTITKQKSELLETVPEVSDIETPQNQSDIKTETTENISADISHKSETPETYIAETKEDTSADNTEVIRKGDIEVKIYGKIDIQPEHKEKKRKKDKKREHPKTEKRKKDIKKKFKAVRKVEKVDIEKESKKKHFDKKFKKKDHKKQDKQVKGKKEINIIDREEVNKAIKEVKKQQHKPVSKSYKKERKKKIAVAEEQQQKIKVPEFIRVSELAKLLDISPSEIINLLIDLDHPATLNYLLDPDLIELVLTELNIPYEIDTETFEEKVEKIINEDAKSPDSVPRPPIVTVMGHVDHGKTTLLDYIRNTRVAEKEKGGITQHIGAYHVVLDEFKDLLDSKIHSITFIDTPGHEAFTSMRAKGTKVTDIAIIVVAADDSVMPTTIEAINHAKAANIPMIFAINKIDKPNANPQKIKEDLLNHGIVLEEFGGPHPSVEISAKTGQNIEKLLELILLQAEILELKANPNRRAIATVIESKVEKGRGPLATLIVRTGTLKKGDPVWAGPFYGKIKAMFNELQNRINEAGPSIPVQIMGLNGTPTPGEPLIVEENEAEAKKHAQQRDREYREISRKRIISLEKIAAKLADTSEKITLPLIIKADVLGSAEAISDSLFQLSNDKIEIQIIHKATGQITENDVTLASASKAIIIGFNVRPSNEARKKAEELKVEIRLYTLIYDLLEDIKAALKGMVKAEKKEQVLGSAEVLKTFKISKVGTVAGCIVRDGKIHRDANVRLIRDGVVVYTGKIASLRRYDKDVNEVLKDYECGIRIENFNDIKVGDFIEAFEMIEVNEE